MAQSDDPGHPDYWLRFLSEAQPLFEAAPSASPSIETLRSLYTHVLRAYHHTCALSGRAFEPATDFLHEHLEIVAIRPLGMGGSLHADNFLALERAAAAAFRGGHLTIGPGLQIIADLSTLDPELLDGLAPGGRLVLPAAGTARPDPAALAFHREHIFMRD